MEPAAGPVPLGRDAYLRAAFLPALGATLLRFTFGVLSPLLALFSYLVPGAAGYVAVRFFEKRNSSVTRSWLGCGLGALTGLLCFLPSFVLQLSTIMIQGKEGYLGAIREQADDLPMATEMLQILEDPAVFAMVIVFGLVLEGLVLLLVSAAGGALAVTVGRSRMERQ